MKRVGSATAQASQSPSLSHYSNGGTSFPLMLGQQSPFLLLYFTTSTNFVISVQCGSNEPSAIFLDSNSIQIKGSAGSWGKEKDPKLFLLDKVLRS